MSDSRYDSSSWNDGARGWVENEAIFDATYAPVTEAVVGAARFGPDMRVLDVGCGSGTLLQAAAKAGAAVVGVDIASDMVEAARRRVPGATVLLGDAQRLDFGAEASGAPFDVVVSRFGVMFFDDPAAAFANIRDFTAPDARMVFACWRGIEENPVFGGAGTGVITARLTDRPAPPAPGQPGPVAYADRDYLAGLLKEAGWSAVSIKPFDALFDHGIDGSDGVEERLATILATTTGRLARQQLAGVLSESEWNELLDAAREDIRRYIDDGSVKIPGAMWLVTATNRH
ncbi:class I SAM-dependent methyltransferase [Gordonia sp. X0973]|uniref:class I SAM-dependent methyltransferase n=1 Tax=Gordonia sp. X0973 TaxID=2742602 RepID=UPI000F52FE22|nr:class I SAM-dependent methyltransferase [Gordonia sp. X0973]QKT06086.1 class I SAM-dependent methyltransferase [Gordonia sp. X0973]